MPASFRLAVVNPGKSHHFLELLVSQVGESDICCSHVLTIRRTLNKVSDPRRRPGWSANGASELPPCTGRKSAGGSFLDRSCQPAVSCVSILLERVCANPQDANFAIG